jgi:uncharacterized protein YkwD
MRKHRWAGGTLVLLTGVAMATVGALGATAETTSVQAGGTQPSLSITPLDGLLGPVLQLVDQTLAPPPPAEPATPVETAPPPPEVQAVQAPAGDVAPSGLAGDILIVMNADRAAHGLAPLSWNGRLAGIGQEWAAVIAQQGVLQHQDMNAVAAATGFAKTGENLLSAPAGYIALQMEASWMNSPGHRANILDPEFSVAGVGIATAADGTIWVAVEFGG